MLATVLLALAASLCWGTADFTAGLKARRVPLSGVLALAQGVGLILAVPVVIASGRPFPDAGQALASLGAGAAVIIGLACFYRALATGTMSVVAPVAATGVAIPVLAGLAGGNHLAAVQAIGMLAAVFGVVLSSRHPQTGAVASSPAGAHRPPAAEPAPAVSPLRRRRPHAACIAMRRRSRWSLRSPSGSTSCSLTSARAAASAGC